MEYYKQPPEQAAPPPEWRRQPELEIAAPPPEFGQTGQDAPAPRKKRRLRQLLAVPALLLLSFLFLHGAKTPANPADAAAKPAGRGEESVAAAPACSGTLEAFDSGEVKAMFSLIPAAGDAHDYQLRVVQMGQRVYDGDVLTDETSLVTDPTAMEVAGDNASGYSLIYVGGSAVETIPQGSQLCIYTVWTDDATGAEYEIVTNRIDAAPARPGSATYPLSDGMIVFTVYNDTLSFDVPSVVEVEDDYRTFLAVDSVDEAGFTGYDLPASQTPPGFTFGGWVVHVGNPMDLGSEVNPFAEYNGDPPVDTLVPEGSFAFRVYGTITPSDVERVPPTVVDGKSIRFVNVHAVWYETEPSNVDFYLDDGFGNVTPYSMSSPMYSEGFLYLCGYPVPEHPGYVFDGWYDKDGNRVELLVSYFSFTPALYDEAGNFVGYDWNAERTPFTLTAHWKQS